MKFLLGLALALVVAQGAVTLSASAQAGNAAAQPNVPAYNPAPKPGTKLPPILPADQRWGAAFQYPFQAHAYELATKIPKVIYQQPCYCYCDRTGHKSLHSCFEGTHAAECATCLKELYFAYAMTRKGLTPAQIRERIQRGEWRAVDLETAATLQ